MSELMVLLLGSPQVERAGVPLSVDTRKATALLAYLCVTQQAHRRDALAAFFWPEYDQAHARATLRRTLSVLNKALGNPDLMITRESIELRTGTAVRLDVEEFRRYLAECQTHGHVVTDVCAQCVTSLSSAIALYRDDFMAGFSLRDSPAFDDWQYFQREAYRRELASALERLTRAFITLYRFDEGIETAQRWLALDRLHEPAYRMLMRLYAWSGHRAAALRQYGDCVHVLEQELGVAPLEATTRLYEAIKANRLASPPPRHATTSSARRSTTSTEPASAGAMPRNAAAGVYPLVGRAAEWETLVRAYDAIRADGRVVMLEGEAGIGKTRLAEELAAHARRLGATVLFARCYDGEATLAYAPIVALRESLADPACTRRIGAVPDRWLSEAARLLPDLASLRAGLPAPRPLDGPGAQSNFFEGVRQVVFAACRSDRPGILFLDDLQWADSASLDLLAYIARRLHGEPLCLLFTVRSPDAGARPEIQRMLAEMQRADLATVISLARLDEGAVRDLVAASAGALVSTETARRLYQETEGVPFFVVEYLTALVDGKATVDQQEWSIPGGIQNLLRSRLGSIGGVSMQVLTAAAVIGRSFDIETVRDVSGRGEEETVIALEDLIAQGLIHERTAPSSALPTYDFIHDKLRSLVYDDMSLARRRLLHRRTAAALIAAQRPWRDGDTLLGQIAHHYLSAGEKGAAAEYYRRAGERARQLYANAEALSHLRIALALGSPDDAALQEAIGDVCTVLGDYAEALHGYEAAITSVAVDTDPGTVSRLERKRGGVHARRGELVQAQHCFGVALALLGTWAARGERARIYADLSLVAHRQGRLDAAQDLAEQARAFAADPEDPRALALAYNILGVLASAQGDVDTAIVHLERSLALAEIASDGDARAAALNNLALACAARGETETALSHAQAALALCVAQGDRHHEAALHNTIADLLHTLGRLDDAMAHVKAAVSIYAEIGVEAGAVRPEIWKLTEW